MGGSGEQKEKGEQEEQGKQGERGNGGTGEKRNNRSGVGLSTPFQLSEGKQTE